MNIPPQITEVPFIQESIAMYTYAKDLLTLLVIPALLWVNSISSEIAVNNIRTESLQGRIEKLETSIDSFVESITTQDRDISGRIVRLEAKVQTMNQRFDRIDKTLDTLLDKQNKFLESVRK